jgi:hypothetical protein
MLPAVIVAIFSLLSFSGSALALPTSTIATMKHIAMNAVIMRFISLLPPWNVDLLFI